MAKFTWQDGTLVSKAKVEIGGVIYDVDPEEYSGTTPLSAANLNAMQDGIYEDLGDKSQLKTNSKTNLVNAINSIIDAEIYSTDEIKTNKVWIDGKPIYRKVVSVNFPTSSSTATTNHNISNIDTVTDYELIWLDTADSKWYKSYKDTTGQYYVQADGISSTSVYVKSGSNYDWAKRTANRYAIIEYTKTTD